MQGGARSYLDGVCWRVQEAGIEVEEGGLWQAALVQAALVGAVRREAQQVCASAHLPQLVGSSHPANTAEAGLKKTLQRLPRRMQGIAQELTVPDLDA